MNNHNDINIIEKLRLHLSKQRNPLLNRKEVRICDRLEHKNINQYVLALIQLEKKKTRKLKVSVKTLSIAILAMVYSVNIDFTV